MIMIFFCKKNALEKPTYFSLPKKLFNPQQNTGQIANNILIEKTFRSLKIII